MSFLRFSLAPSGRQLERADMTLSPWASHVKEEEIRMV